jgi:lysozyme
MPDTVAVLTTEEPTMFRRHARHKAPNKKRRVLVAVLVIGLLAGGAYGGLFLYHRGYIQINNPSLSDYPVRGVDVSEFQRGIDWASLVEGSKISFAFIRASEGSRVQDRRFRANWSAARGLVARSAYHFFTFCTPGDAQVTNFLDVMQHGSELPAAVDVEFSGNCTSWISLDAVRTQLHIFLSAVRSATGRTPILYVTSQSFERIVRGHFNGYPLWVRDVVSAPSAKDYPHLSFWQYAGNGRAQGVRGLIDLNAFVGSRAEYNAFLRRGVAS